MADSDAVAASSQAPRAAADRTELSGVAKQMGLTLKELSQIVPDGAVVDLDAAYGGGHADSSLHAEFDAAAVAQLGETKKGSWRDRIRRRD